MRLKNEALEAEAHRHIKSLTELREELSKEKAALQAMAVEAGYRACERGWNLQKTFAELLG